MRVSTWLFTLPMAPAAAQHDHDGGADAGAVSMGSADSETVYLTAWTTTPWTLPSNTALTVGPGIEYVKVRTKNQYTDDPNDVVLAKDLVEKWFGGHNQPVVEAISEPFSGSQLVGLRYEQLLTGPTPTDGDAWRVIPGNFVTTDAGTGIVHTAPSFGQDDMTVGKANGIGSLTLVDKQGKFTDEAGEFAGRYVKDYKEEAGYVDVNVDIAVSLKKRGQAFNVAKYNHSYPHCWRTDKPVLYYPLDSWFIKASAVKERMAELNDTINWQPESTGTGRFGKWLENLNDWNLSRSRYWGIPLPIWRNADGTEEICIGSIAELQEQIDIANRELGLQQEVPKDLHRPYIDEVVLWRNGRKLNRELDLIDVWFDSGSMPYAQWGYPPNPPRGGSAREDTYSLFDNVDPEIRKMLTTNAKKNRKSPTKAEAAFWEIVRAKKVQGFKFRREHPIGPFIADFANISKHLIFEIDGGYHDTPEQQKYDQLRTKYLKYYGWKVYRFTNEQVLKYPGRTLATIKRELAQTPTLSKEERQNNWGQSPPFGGARGGAFPADFIAEGVDQTRGWFYTLHAIATMCFDSVAYKNVVSNGLVLDKEGKKMSKRLGNAVDPFETIDAHGADATRWYMISNANPWDNLKFNEEGIKEVRRTFFGTLYNTYGFLALYANVDDYDPATDQPVGKKDLAEIDRWIISRLHSLTKEVSQLYAAYDATPACRAIENFVNAELSNWYVRQCRRRFWKGEMSADKRAAYQTLHRCLVRVAQLMSPVAPFYAERLYLDLLGADAGAVDGDDAPSVHLSLLPATDESLIDTDLEARMEYAQRLSSLTLSLRKADNLRVRQPLQKILVPATDEEVRRRITAVADIIKNETNIKEVELLTDGDFLKKSIKPNFRVLGKKVGKMMKLVAQQINGMTTEDIAVLEKSGAFLLTVEGEDIALTMDDVVIATEDIPGWKVATDGELTVALDVTITPELAKEGLARELVNRIQHSRKEQGYEVTDRIRVRLQGSEAVEEAATAFRDYISEEVLADSLVLDGDVAGEGLELPGGEAVTLAVSRV